MEEDWMNSMIGNPIGTPCFNPAGFADTVEEWLEHGPDAWQNDHGEWFDDVEDYIDFAIDVATRGDGFVQCSGCADVDCDHAVGPVAGGEGGP